MKKAIVISALLLCFMGLAWGDRTNVISVLSFEMNPTDMEAMTNRVTDDSGDLTALIKIETTARGFEFDCGSMGIVEVNEEHPGEIWVYVQQSATRITISHNEWGILRDYKFPTGDLMEGRTYVMKIATDRSDVDDATLIQSQFLEIQVYPPDAMVEIDGEHVDVTSKGVATKWVAIGKHNYRVTAKGFRPMPGVADVNDVHNKTTIQVRLKPAVGYLRVEDVQEYTGAAVYVDNGKVGTMPLDSILLESGTHTLRISKKMFKPLIREVDIEDGKTSIITPRLESNCATVTISTGLGTEIWANGTFLGNGRWSGQLEAGHTVIEARKKGYKTTVEAIELGADKVADIEIAEPYPAYGKITVSSNPQGAKVIVDGKEIGQTPISAMQVLIGDHELKIEKKGYQTEIGSIDIIEDKETTIEKEMIKAHAVDMDCKITEAEWWIDDKYYGKGGKMKTWLGEGRHIIKVTAAGHDDYLTALDIEKGRNSYDFELTPILPDTISFTANKVSFKMVRVKGGYFEMGNAKGNKTETPQHTVTLNSYYISETEVTQELWMAVTGITVDALRQLFTTTTDETKLVGKGNNMPMYFVNWEDCQNFIQQLNQSTGQNFQLPTEAQWEYAAKGGNGENQITAGIWSIENSQGKVHDVGTTKHNGLGLYDMQGNLWEWCRDWYGGYQSDAQTNPKGAEAGKQHVLRGGSWADYKVACRTTFRISALPTERSNRIGFRLVLEIRNEKK